MLTLKDSPSIFIRNLSRFTTKLGRMPSLLRSTRLLKDGLRSTKRWWRWRWRRCRLCCWRRSLGWWRSGWCRLRIGKSRLRCGRRRRSCLLSPFRDIWRRSRLFFRFKMQRKGTRRRCRLLGSSMSSRLLNFNGKDKNNWFESFNHNCIDLLSKLNIPMLSSFLNNLKGPS